MKQVTRFLCALLAGLVLCGTAAAEAPHGLQTLLDLTAAAALDGKGQVCTITADGTLDPDFVYHVLTLGQRDYAEAGVTPQMLDDVAAQRTWLSAHYFSEPGDLAGILWFEEETPHVAVNVTLADFSDDGDSAVLKGTVTRGGEDLGLHVRMDARREPAAACGWRVLLFGLDGVAQEESADALFADSMVEYISPELGFSVQYPALFAETAEEHPDGVDGRLADGTASFYVSMTLPANRAGETAEGIIAGLQAEHPDVVVEVNEANEMIVARWQENGTTVCRGYFVTEDVLCMARIAWDVAVHPELERLSEYMMNSLSVDALGVG